MNTKHSIKHQSCSARCFFYLSAITILLLSGSLQAAVPDASDVTLTTAQWSALVGITEASPDAAPYLATIKKIADGALNATPHPIPQMLTLTHEKISGDARKNEKESLNDMKKMQALAYLYATTKQTQYSDKARQFILSWSKTYQPIGHPLAEERLKGLYTTYAITRSTFPPEQRVAVDSWLHEIAQAVLSWDAGHHRNNNIENQRWNIVGSLGFALNDNSLTEKMVRGYKSQMEANYHSNGASNDFYNRDAMHYHFVGVRDMLDMAMMGYQHGIDLYHYQAQNGASLSKAVKFGVPYCNGTKTHHEWVHDKDKHDWAKGAKGEQEYIVGRLFDPKECIPSLSMAALFDPSYLALVNQIKNTQSPFPTWQAVLNAAIKQAAPAQ